ncbi:hypothetical protein KFE26_13825 [Shewanella sp. M16]|uniref:hypothetical protein n=1 Tax=Shewanella sp. M16 TaxID=2830837 RepID=UPI001BAE7E1F|nr:hypothetical protein [Shewanella sp. M16]MBS0043370.1 hypothetical protein [Shewanella sp. M16]QYW06209.1 spanin [Shewanella phage vB_SspS_MuM16-1]
MTPSQISIAIQWLIVSLFVAVLCLAQYQLATTRSQLTQALADKSTLQTDADNLADSLRKSNADKAALAAESEQLALQLQQVSLQKAELMGRHHALKNQLNQLLQDTTDEDAKAWRDAPVPNDVVRLLSHAADCAQRARLHDSVCVAARSTDARVPSDPSATASDPVPTDSTNFVPSQPSISRVDAVSHR